LLSNPKYVVLGKPCATAISKGGYLQQILTWGMDTSLLMLTRAFWEGLLNNKGSEGFGFDHFYKLYPSNPLVE
jgi:hypothetical protein